MKRHWCLLRRRLVASLCGLAITGGLTQEASAQPPILPASSSNVTASPSAPTSAATRTTEETAPPASPVVSPGPMSLDACIDLGFRHQPAIDAAHASLSAARTGQSALNRLIIPRLFTPDYRIRQQQACHGVAIAEAGLTQAEWETRYSITRNFFTVQYIRAQEKVILEVLDNLTRSRKKAYDIYTKGGVDSKITLIDIEFLDVQLAQVTAKKSQVDNGKLKAIAALREAMGLNHDYPLEIAAVDLPPAVYVQKVPVKDDTGKPVVKDGKPLTKDVYHQLFQLNKSELIASALANRGELAQATLASRITDLEIQAQYRIWGWQGKTFASASDLHAKPIPQGIFNNEYRPGAIGFEMPVFLIGRKKDRAQRAADFAQRGNAVVDKATNLVSLDVEAQYLKWQEAADEVKELIAVQETAKNLPDRVLKLNPNEFTSTAVIQANMTAVMCRTQLNDAMHMHALALAGLERATAGAFRVYPIPEAPLAMPTKK